MLRISVSVILQHILSYMSFWGTGRYIKYIPANKYMTPVTKTALIWCWNTPKAPTRAALPKTMRQTRAQEIDKFCIPVGKRICHSLIVFIPSINLDTEKLIQLKLIYRMI